VHSDCLHVCGLGGHGVCLSVRVHCFVSACVLVSRRRLHTSCSVFFVFGVGRVCVFVFFLCWTFCDSVVCVFVRFSMSVVLCRSLV